MKVYKYTVYQITPRGKHINIFEKVIQSEMSYVELSDYLIDKYTGFNVNVEEIKVIETIGSTSKKTYISYEKMYEHCINASFNLDYSNDEDFNDILKRNREIEELKQKFRSKVLNEVKENPKYKGITIKSIDLKLSNKDSVILTGEVMLKDLNLVQD